LLLFSKGFYLGWLGAGRGPATTHLKGPKGHEKFHPTSAIALNIDRDWGTGASCRFRHNTRDSNNNQQGLIWLTK
jgi:hypothetical protein